MSKETRALIRECIASVKKEDLPASGDYPWFRNEGWTSKLTRHNVYAICSGVDMEDIICINYDKVFGGFLFTEEGFAYRELFYKKGKRMKNLISYRDLERVKLSDHSFNCSLQYHDGREVTILHSNARYIGIVVNRILDALYGRTEKNEEQQVVSEEKILQTDKDEDRTPEELFLAGAEAEKEENMQEAVRLYRLAAEKGSASAAWNLSVMYAGGKGIPENPEESFRWQLFSAQEGNANAMYAVAKNYYYGKNGTEEDDEQALFWAKKAKESGALPADTPVDDLILKAERHVTFDAARAAYKTGDFEEAIRQYQRSAELGSSNAAWNLSIMYIRGEGVTEDSKESFKWKLRCAELGDAEAMYSVADCYYHGDLGADRDNEQALFWAKKAKDSGKLPDAKTDKLISEIQEEINGQHFLRGVGAYKRGNYAEAFRQFLIAADEGKAGAAWNLSIMCARGEGTEKDERESFRWKVRAAELGYLDAMLCAAQDYHAGENGAEKNREQALFWAKKVKENTERSRFIEQANQLIQEIENAPEEDPLSAAFDAYEAGDFAEAAKLFRIAAEKGDANAAYLMAVLYTNGEGVPKDEQESFRWQMRAAQLGHADAMYFVAVSYYRGAGGAEQDYEQALFWAEKAKENGEFLEDRPVDNLLRVIRQSIEEEDVSSVAEEVDFDEAVEKLEYLAEQGDADCAWLLATVYRVGELVPEDKEESLRWQLHAAQLGNADAMYAMAVCCFNGDEGVKQDYEQALLWAKKAKESGELSEDMPVDDLIRDCEGRTAFLTAQVAEDANDFEEAVRQYTAAAQKDVPEAALWLGITYQDGDLVPRDISQAVRWLEKASELGSVEAQYVLGMMYNFGDDGLRTDKIRAAKWLQMASEAGHPAAQFYFGIMCLNGEGVPRDRERGKQYFIKSASQGYHDSDKLLQEQFGFTGHEFLDAYLRKW